MQAAKSSRSSLPPVWPGLPCRSPQGSVQRETGRRRPVPQDRAKWAVWEGGNGKTEIPDWPTSDWQALQSSLVCQGLCPVDASLMGPRHSLCLGPSKHMFLSPRRDSGSVQSKIKRRTPSQDCWAMMVGQKPAHQMWLSYILWAHSS